MPRIARLDTPGLLHHIMIRGIERRKIFKDNKDSINLIKRLSILQPETKTQCYAWSLLSNHAHFLLRSGPSGIAALMRRLLTGYAVSFNRRHKRHGQLFQNRYKSIICQEDAYLMELLRYIHLNPLRAKLVADLNELDSYLYCGHSALIGKRKREWQETGYVLKYFDKRISAARKKYRSYVEEGIELEKDYITGKGRQQDRVIARDLLCYWASVELGITIVDLARRLDLTPAAVSYAVQRGEKLAKEKNYQLIA